MKILVCMKQVPQKDAPLKLNESGTWIREDVSYEVNEPDAFALEEALRQKEKHSGEVVVITAGPARAQQVLREALAKGADRAIHLEDNVFVGLDAANTARAFAAAIKEEKFDLIFTGLQSDDYGYAQTGVVLAELLGWPHATIIMRLEDIEADYASMAELARANHIAVVFSSVLPVHNYTPKSQDFFAQRSPEKILSLNRWLKDYCAGNGLIYLDYFTAMVDEKGLLKRDLAEDGLHPNAAGFKIMAPLAEAAIGKALAKKP